MQIRTEIKDLVHAINEASPGTSIRLQEDELARLEGLLHEHPECWPVGLADTFALLKRKLRWETIDRKAIPEALRDFFDEQFRRDLDPMALARNIGQDICGSCADCGCRC